MTEWVLILTIFYRAPAITNIPGFTSAADCIKAGEAWKKQMEKEGGTSQNFLCVERPPRAVSPAPEHRQRPQS